MCVENNHIDIPVSGIPGIPVHFRMNVAPLSRLRKMTERGHLSFRWQDSTVHIWTLSLISKGKMAALTSLCCGYINAKMWVRTVFLREASRRKFYCSEVALLYLRRLNEVPTWLNLMKTVKKCLSHISLQIQKKSVFFLSIKSFFFFHFDIGFMITKHIFHHNLKNMSLSLLQCEKY